MKDHTTIIEVFEHCGLPYTQPKHYRKFLKGVMYYFLPFFKTNSFDYYVGFIV